MPRLDHLALNPRVLAVTFALATITGILAGLLPAVQLWRGHAAPTLRVSAPTTTGMRSMARWRGLLMAAEIAAALTLAVGAALLGQSLIRLARVDLGFESRDVLLFTVRLPETKYRDAAARVALVAEVERRVAAIPGVASAALANSSSAARRRIQPRADRRRRIGSRRQRPHGGIPGGERGLLRDAARSRWYAADSCRPRIAWARRRPRSLSTRHSRDATSPAAIQSASASSASRAFRPPSRTPSSPSSASFTMPAATGHARISHRRCITVGGAAGNASVDAGGGGRRPGPPPAIRAA